MAFIPSAHLFFRSYVAVQTVGFRWEEAAARRFLQPRSGFTVVRTMPGERGKVATVQRCSFTT